MHERRTTIAQQLLGAVDLAIDFATLGEYGLEAGEPGSASGFPRNGCGERSGRETGWEALATPTVGHGRTSRRAAGRCRLDRRGVPTPRQAAAHR